MEFFVVWFFLLHLASTLYMVGLIWFVQIVHYPLHGLVGSGNFSRYQTQHMKYTGYVVGPPMLIEAITAVLLLWHSPQGIPSWATILGASLLLGIWLSTAFFQVPIHNKLLSHFNPKIHNSLVWSNWLRTLMWSARGILVLWLTSLLINM